MDQVGLMEAWGRWIAGSSVESLYLWGIKILWWGRVGKLAEFAAGLAVLVEIVGTDRLRKFGESISTSFPRERVRDLAKSSRGRLRDVGAFLFSDFGTVREREALDRLDSSTGWSVAEVAASLLGAIVGAVLIGRAWTWWFAPIALFLLFCLLFVTIGPLIVILMVALLSAIGWFIDTALIRPMAWLLERPKLGQLVKVISLIVFAIGFHFDLLAS